MPDTASITPSTPSEIVAIRDANRAPSISLFHGWIQERSPGSTSRSPARRLLVRTTPPDPIGPEPMTVARAVR
jgi:hypothetical protein